MITFDLKTAVFLKVKEWDSELVGKPDHICIGLNCSGIHA